MMMNFVNDGSQVDVVDLDFQKAFDKVPHQRLLELNYLLLELKTHDIDLEDDIYS